MEPPQDIVPICLLTLELDDLIVCNRVSSWWRANAQYVDVPV